MKKYFKITTEQFSEMNKIFHMYQGCFSEGPCWLSHAAFTAAHIHQSGTVTSENSIHTGTGHAHAGYALVHEKLSPWPLKKPVSNGWLPAKGAKLTSTVSKDMPAKDYTDMWSI